MADIQPPEGYLLQNKEQMVTEIITRQLILSLDILHIGQLLLRKLPLPHKEILNCG